MFIADAIFYWVRFVVRALKEKRRGTEKKEDKA